MISLWLVYIHSNLFYVANLTFSLMNSTTIQLASFLIRFIVFLRKSCCIWKEPSDFWAIVERYCPGEHRFCWKWHVKCTFIGFMLSSRFLVSEVMLKPNNIRANTFQGDFQVGFDWVLNLRLNVRDYGVENPTFEDPHIFLDYEIIGLLMFEKLRGFYFLFLLFLFLFFCVLLTRCIFLCIIKSQTIIFYLF